MGTSLQPSGPRTRSLRAPVLEVFASIQGEGRFVGQPQTFLRLAGCPLRCRWCDTPGSWLLPDVPDERRRARIAGGAQVEREQAWGTPFHVATWIARVEEGRPRTLSVTGGEPLVWPDFLLALRGFLGGRRMHLETAGGHPRALARVLPAVDHVSLDLKLPEDLEPPVPLVGGPADLEAPPHDARTWTAARRADLELLHDRDACAKLPVAGDREPRAFLPLLDDLARLAPDLPLVLQPLTPVGGAPRPDRDLLETLLELALDRGLGVRVVPQVHRVLGLP